MKQNVVLYKNERYKLAHIGIFNVTLSSGAKNYGHYLCTQIAKAKWAHDNALVGKIDHAFSASLVPWLINTQYTGWTEEMVAEDVELETANFIKTEMALDLKNAGYEINVTTKYSSPRNPKNGTYGWTGKIPKSPTAIKNFLEKVTLGIEFRTPARRSTLINDINTLVNYPTGSLRVLNRNLRMEYKSDAWLACIQNR